MSHFPRTMIEDLSVSRLIMGTNWFLGFSHWSKAKDEQIKRTMNASKIADVMEVFLDAGVDTLLGRGTTPILQDAIKDACDRTGRPIKLLSTPILNADDGVEARDELERALDAEVAVGASVVMPHMVTTDPLIDRKNRRIVGMDRLVESIRRRGLIPGLSTHSPETVVYADETDLDVGTYIQIYNAAGFLMHVEVDWVHRSIWNARKPVITIKPLAAGRLLPLVGLAFNWATIRQQDMICIGTHSPDEAREVIELSLSLLEHRAATVELQRTRSKAILERQ